MRTQYMKLGCFKKCTKRFQARACWCWLTAAKEEEFKLTCLYVGQVAQASFMSWHGSKSVLGFSTIPGDDNIMLSSDRIRKA